LRILIFSMQPEPVYGKAVKQFNVHHYIHKSEGEEEIVKKLAKFLNNENTGIENKKMENMTNPFALLAPRELEVLHYILRGNGTKSIGEVLNIQMSTVSTLKNRILEKTNSNNVKELLELATLYNINY
jgi:two-component system invasion response regulator UvrY